LPKLNCLRCSELRQQKVQHMLGVSFQQSANLNEVRKSSFLGTSSSNLRRLHYEFLLLAGDHIGIANTHNVKDHVQKLIISVVGPIALCINQVLASNARSNVLCLKTLNYHKSSNYSYLLVFFRIRQLNLLLLGFLGRQNQTRILVRWGAVHFRFLGLLLFAGQIKSLKIGVLSRG
jgi:hypothetical protein